MTRNRAPKIYEVPTTNFILDLNKIDRIAVQQRYQLLTIELPDSYNYLSDKLKFAKLHNAYKEQLELPYYFFSNAKPKPTIFILSEKTNKDISIYLNFDFLKNEVVYAKKANFLELCTPGKLHILAKLFFADYFYNFKKNYRICQGRFYIDSNKWGNRATVLEVDIRQIRGASEFCFKQKATYLMKVDKTRMNNSFISSDAYCELLQGEKYYKQIKPSNVKQWQVDKNDLRELWKAVTGTLTDKPSIKWFEDYDNIARCKSTLLHEFQGRLIKYYNETLGEDFARQQIHKMQEILPVPQSVKPGNIKKSGLFLGHLKEIGVLDLRFKEASHQNQIPFHKYIDFFNDNYAEKHNIKFSEISRIDLESTEKSVLVLQDIEKKDFESGENDQNGNLVKAQGILFEAGYFEDPKPKIYSEFAQIVPLQTMNINFNDASEHSLLTYFDYQMLGECLEHLGSSYKEIEEKLALDEKEIKKSYKSEKLTFGEILEETKEKRKENERLRKYLSLITNKIDVCLNKFLLKTYIIRQLPITDFSNASSSLPYVLELPSLTNYAYMYQGFFMYIDDAFTLQFIDLESKTGKEKRNDYLLNLEIKWSEIENQFAQRNYTRNENGHDKVSRFGNQTENEIKRTHFIFANNMALAIEDTDERVLHKYEPEKKGKSQRKGEYKTALEGIYFSEEKQIYTVGYKSLNITAEHSVIVRKLHYYQKPKNFSIDDLLQTLLAQFVRNQQYTVYPYFFDLLNLYQNDIMQKNENQ